MTTYNTENLTCPQCNAQQDSIVYHSINVKLDPDLRDKLFNGEINAIKCHECGNELFVSVPLLYHDMERKFCVWYIPTGVLDDEEFYKDFSVDGLLNYPDLLGK